MENQGTRLVENHFVPYKKYWVYWAKLQFVRLRRMSTTLSLFCPCPAGLLWAIMMGGQSRNRMWCSCNPANEFTAWPLRRPIFFSKGSDEASVDVHWELSRGSGLGWPGSCVDLENKSILGMSAPKSLLDVVVVQINIKCSMERNRLFWMYILHSSSVRWADNR